jgi:hypothetical protein
MSSYTILALRCIVPGAFFALVGLGMLTEPEFRRVAWGPVLAGPARVIVGIYILVRSRSSH